MQRIQRINQTDAPAKTADLLATVQKEMGAVPNILATMAQSPAALGGYLGFAGALGGGRLSATLREQIALTVAGANGCDYCASVHTALGRHAGLDREELRRNLSGESSDRRTAAALAFTVQVLQTRGNVSDAELAGVREAGFDDEEIVEIVANTALNIFTNYFNHVAETDIDFPAVRTGTQAAA